MFDLEKCEQFAKHNIARGSKFCGKYKPPIRGNCTSKTCPSMYDLEERNPLSLFKPPSDLRSPKFAAIFALDEAVEDEDRGEIQAKNSHRRLSSRTGDGKRSDI